ncbi:MAG: hypothetical protein HY075_06840 [Deltaproteobacteria bacterium]|nr:hypothetical protein [Deltaproteobacteria bacterium]
MPDLTPAQRSQLVDFSPEIAFVAESPHVSEVAPDLIELRRPLCGKAGQAFWKMVGELVEGEASQDTSLERMLRLARAGRFAVLNSVQFPLDPKVCAEFPEADPVAHLGFSKIPPASYKKLRAGRDVPRAVELLRERLVHPRLAGAAIVSLGNDAEWFVSAALGQAAGEGRHVAKIPHPSAWWRQGGKLRERAREQLTELLVKGLRPSRNAASARARP